MQVREHEARSDTHCPYCRAPLASEETWRCPSCETRHHAECARENGRCTVFGCTSALAGAEQPRAPSRFLRQVVLAVGVLGVLTFAAKFSTLRGESLLDPVIIGLFFVAITVWGTIYDGATARSRARGTS